MNVIGFLLINIKMFHQRSVLIAMVMVCALYFTAIECRRLEGRRHNRHKPKHNGMLPFPFNDTTTHKPNNKPKPSPTFKPFGFVKPTRKPQKHSVSTIRGSRKAVVVTKKTYLRKEWCKTQPLKQVIREQGCLRTTVINSFCYGQCNSFFIPKSDKNDENPAAFMSCGFCKPRKYRMIIVTLRCPGKKGMRFKRKRVMRIKKCRCMSVDVNFP
uniref:Gremlin n=1 Tax=Lottia goshimai TaxID=1824450 RepID=A0A7D5B8A7_9GAST|nr:gremlin [Lottia goshimai]